jgi:hypothetical protein
VNLCPSVAIHFTLFENLRGTKGNGALAKACGLARDIVE